MSRSAKRPRAAGLRKYRNRIQTDRALIAGNPRLGEIVYGYRFPSHPGRMKIGYSSRGLARVSEQSTAFPEMPELVFVIHHPQAKRLEGAFHDALAHRQANVMGTEWFEVEMDDLLKISPQLRQAAGRGAARRLRHAFGFLACAAIGLALYPPLAQSQAAFALGMPPTQIGDIWSAHVSVLLALDIGSLIGSWEWARALTREAALSPAAQAITAGAAALPLLAPLWLRRRQVR